MIETEMAMVSFRNKKNGYVYETRTEVSKTPHGKYRVHGYIEVTYPNGRYEIEAKQTLTFDMRKDADAFAKQVRRRFTKTAKEYARA